MSSAWKNIDWLLERVVTPLDSCLGIYFVNLDVILTKNRERWCGSCHSISSSTDLHVFCGFCLCFAYSCIYMYFSVMFTILCRNHLDFFSLEMQLLEISVMKWVSAICSLYYLFIYCLSSAVEFTLQLAASIQWLEIVLYEGSVINFW